MCTPRRKSEFYAAELVESLHQCTDDAFIFIGLFNRFHEDGPHLSLHRALIRRCTLAKTIPHRIIEISNADCCHRPTSLLLTMLAPVLKAQTDGSILLLLSDAAQLAEATSPDPDQR
jgi:hypothetical protein